MKTRFILSFLLILLLIGAALFTVACHNDGGEESTETDAPAPSLSATDVDALIAGIGGATLENEKKLDEAYLAYCALSEEERAKVTGFDTLQEYRRELTKAYVVKEYLNTRIPHHKLLIGSYRVPGTTEGNLQALVDCHFDFIWNADTTALDLVAEKGLGVFQRSSTFDGIEWWAEGLTEEDFRASIEGLACDHPAVWAIDHTDEPMGQQIVDYWKFGKIIAEELFPHSAAFMNLLPFYGYSDNVEAFRTDMELYFSTVGVTNDIASFDHYVYMYETPHRYFDYTAVASLLDNLSIFSEYCRTYGQDMFMIGQQADPMDLEPKYTLSTEQIKFQAYTALAYGAKSISWYSMEAFPCFILDENGNPTELFGKLEEVNGDLKALEPIFMRYTGASNAVLHGSKCPAKKALAPYQGNRDVSLMTQESLTDITVEDRSAVLVGHFEKNMGDGEAFLFVGLGNYLFTKETEAEISFKTADADAEVIAYVKGIATKLTPNADGVYTITVQNADAVFVTVD